MKYYFVVGERSGDMHASNLINELLKLDPTSKIRGLGGELMKNQGADIYKNYAEIAFMGFLEVFKNLPKIMAVMKEVKADIISFHPDVIVLVDFGGFNMKIAAFAKVNNIKVFYYISPKIWAWNQKRALKIKNLVDKMFVILPFEENFYKQFDYKVEYVGNPVYDSIRFFSSNGLFSIENKDLKPIIALLPGSRKQEIVNMLTVMKDLPSQFQKYKFVVAAVSNIPISLYREYLGDSDLEIIVDKTYDLLSVSHAAVVTSGTATLETALFEIPQVVVYKTSWLSYKLAKAFIKIKYISLVNLVSDKEVVKELIQQDFNSDTVKEALISLIEDIDKRKEILEDYKKIKLVLGERIASMETAKLMHYYLKQ